MNNKTLVVVGGGAAGFFCAVNAARLYPQARVILIEKTNKLLSKVKVSGGGRCNVTHACFSIAEMIKKYPRGEKFLKKAFHHFFTTDTIQWFLERGVNLKTEADGRMFPVSDSSQTIIDCMLNEASRYKVEILMSTAVESINKSNTGFTVEITGKDPIEANAVCIACGGFARAEQFSWLVKTGHTFNPPVPSLFTFNLPKDPVTSLMGITIENVIAKIAGTKLQESGPLLITHWGFSGPAILKLSAWGARALADMQYDFTVIINWIPLYHEGSLQEKIRQIRFEIASQKIVNRNPFGLPGRLWEYLLSQSGIDGNIRWADLPGKEQNKLVKYLCGQEFKVKGKTTFKEEFVTAGGIELSQIEAGSMQSKTSPGLFFAGEILDIDGVTGGFNFQNAWTTGWIAAKGIGEYLS